MKIWWTSSSANFWCPPAKSCTTKVRIIVWFLFYWLLLIRFLLNSSRSLAVIEVIKTYLANLDSILLPSTSRWWSQAGHQAKIVPVPQKILTFHILSELSNERCFVKRFSAYQWVIFAWGTDTDNELPIVSNLWSLRTKMTSVIVSVRRLCRGQCG